MTRPFLPAAAAAIILVAVSAVAAADVRVTAVTAVVDANASASDRTIEDVPIRCDVHREGMPPLAAMQATAIESIVRSCNEDSSRRAFVYGVQARAHVDSTPLTSAGPQGPISFLDVRSHASVTNILGSGFSGSAHSNVSVTIALDSPTLITITVGSGFASGGPGHHTVTTDIPGLTLPSPSSGRVELPQIRVEPGSYTVTASTSTSSGGAHNAGITLTFGALPRRPVFLIPGIGATYAADPSADSAWLTTRGMLPIEMQIDPLSRAYHDLLQTLRNVGYVEGRDLFVVNYDWRLPPGPDDGVIDGEIGGLTAHEISRGRYRYAVDYLGDLLKRAAEQWAADYPALPPLDAVDVIAHSTGGLVARTYIQSAAYGAAYDADRLLPRINHLIMIGVPNRGASKAWNPLHDNWSVDPAFRLVLSKIVNRAYQKVLQGTIIHGPDHDISLAMLQSPACAPDPEVCFIKLYVPTARALLATYDFIDRGNGLTNVNQDLAARNSLVLDLNAGLDRGAPAGDPNAFVDRAKVSVIYGTNGPDTPVHVVQRLGPSPSFPLRGSLPISGFRDFVPRDARFNETYYEDVLFAEAGDGTVPLESSAGQFLFDTRVRLLPFTKGVNTSASVGHVDLMFNPDVQKAVLHTLSIAFEQSQISAGLGGVSLGVPCAVTGCLNFILDPVEGFVVDAQGRRLGYTTATGPLTEIPGSVWFGSADGIGWVFGPIEGPLSVQLVGLGSAYYVQATVETATARSGLTLTGFLAENEATSAVVPGVVPRPGDIDLDDDVDNADLNLLLARRNTVADGPNDPRDLDGNGRIDALDSRQLTLLCTRPRCAVK